MTKLIVSVSFCCLLMVIAACQSSSYKNILQKFQLIPDTFWIDNTKDTIITGSKGTLIYIEKESFLMSEGKQFSKKVAIILKECYNNADIIREDLSTESNGHLLSSGGMIYIDALSNDKTIKLKSAKKIIIHFPKTRIQNVKMNLFYANSGDGGLINWQPDSSNAFKTKGYLTEVEMPEYMPSKKIEENRFDTAKMIKHEANIWHHNGEFKIGTEDTLSKYIEEKLDGTLIYNSDSDIKKCFEVVCSLDKFGKLKIKNINIRNKNLIINEKGRYVADTSLKNGIFLRKQFEFLESIVSLKPYIRQDGNQVDTSFTLHISISPLPPNYKTDSQYLQYFYTQFLSKKNKIFNTNNDIELDYYIFTASKLGWINSDYFLKSNNKQIDFIVKAPDVNKTKVKIIFKELQSIMDGTRYGDHFVFANVPLNSKVKILTLTNSIGKTLMSVTETTLKKEPFCQFSFKEFSIDDLNKELSTY